MKDRTPMAVMCLKISAVLYAVLGLLCFAALVIPSLRSQIDVVIGVVLTGVCVVLVVVIEIIARGLSRRRFWAWVAAIGVFAVYVPSLFLPLGVLGLWGLIAPGSRLAFGIGGVHAQAGAAAEAGSP